MILRLPRAEVVGCFLLAFFAFGAVVRTCDRPSPPQAAPAPSLAPLRDSLLRVRVLDSLRLHAWADSVVRLRGDSLRAVFGRRVAALRPRVVRVVEVDTLRDSVVVGGADLRTVLVADSACRVEVDSLRGVVAIREAERDSVAAIPQPRPWGWFAAGVAVGAGACLFGAAY